MDCRIFRDRHLAFLDRSLPVNELNEMEIHRAHCAWCGRHDTALRRGLLLLHNSPDIQPSSDFRARLHRRLDAMKRAGDRPPFHGPTWRSFAAATVAVIMVGYVAAVTITWMTPRQPLALAPVIASTPDFINVADVTTLPSADPESMPMWPAVQLAEHAPMHFVSVDYQDADYQAVDWR